MFVSEAIFYVDLVEKRYHIFCLVFGVVYLFNAVEDNTEYNFMRHNASIVQKIAIALLNALYR